MSKALFFKIRLGCLIALGLALVLGVSAIRAKNISKRIDAEGVARRATVIDKQQITSYKGASTYKVAAGFAFENQKVGIFFAVPKSVHDETEIGDEVEIKHLPGDAKSAMMGKHRSIHLGDPSLAGPIGIGIAAILIAWLVGVYQREELAKTAAAASSEQAAPRDDENGIAHSRLAPGSSREREFEFALPLRQLAQSGACTVAATDTDTLPDWVAARATLGIANPDDEDDELVADVVRAEIEFHLGATPLSGVSHISAEALTEFLDPPQPEFTAFDRSPAWVGEAFAGSQSWGPIQLVDDRRSYSELKIGAKTYEIRIKYLDVTSTLVPDTHEASGATDFWVLVTDLHDADAEIVPPFVYRRPIGELLLKNNTVFSDEEECWEERDGHEAVSFAPRA